MLASHLRGVAADGLVADEGAQPREREGHVVGGDGPADHRVEQAEQVLDVLLRRGHGVRVAHPLGVGRPDQPVGPRGQDEQDALARRHDQCRLAVDGRAGQPQVDALGPDDADGVVGLGEHRGDLRRPHPHAQGDVPRRDDVLVAAQLVAHHHPVDTLRLVRQPSDERGVRGHMGALASGRTRDGHRQPGVVHLRVVVLERTDERIRPQVRESRDGAPLGHVAMPGHRTRPADDVVGEQAGTHVQPLPHPVLQRQHERQGPHQMRCEGGEQQLALPQGLPDEGDVALLQVPEAAVDELAGLARRAARDVALVDEADGQPPRRGIERGAGARGTRAHDEEVEDLRLHGPHGRLTACRAQRTAHGLPSLTSISMRSDVSP